MFEKLLSLLPYNPSLAHQMAFYSRRMREEAAIRRVGLVFVALAFLIQFFAVISPPQPTVASSTSDLINGGFTHKSEAVSACNSNTKDYRTIMANYGITCADINAASEVQLHSTSYGNTLYTMGWNPDGSRNPVTGRPTREVPATLQGINHTFYWHLVSNTDPKGDDNGRDRKALKLTSSVTHKTYFILYDCGNLVSIGVPPTVPPCPYVSGILTGDSRCHPAPCPLDSSIYVTNSKCKACPYNAHILKSDKQCVACPNPRYPTVAANSPQCKPVCPYNKAFDKGDKNCKPCTASSNSADALACISESKTAADTTQNWPDANGKTAQPNDVIVYTLYAKNTGKAVVPDFEMRESLSDVLDYATPVDLNGGTLDTTTGDVTWPKVDIKAGATLSHQITVKVKSPIPETPPSVSDPSHFDRVMCNVYGNSICINLPPSIVHTIVTNSLPNTGPGTGLFIAGAIVILAGYFYSRSRLLAKESSMVLHESATV